MSHHRVLRIVAKVLIPFILLFALYVQFHGDFGPGGGFQAGVIFAAAFVLHAIVFGVTSTERALPPALVHRLVSAGFLIFLLVGFAAMLRGGEFLNYSVLGATQQAGQHLGILLIEFGVGVTVAATMISIFLQFARRSLDE